MLYIGWHLLGQHLKCMHSCETSCVVCCLCLQKLAEMAEVLEAREKKLVELSRSNMDLTETNNILRKYGASLIIM